MFQQDVEPSQDSARRDRYNADLPRYRADIAAAWDVMERIRELEDRRPGITGAFTAHLDEAIWQMSGKATLWQPAYGQVSTPALICRAAPEAVDTDRHELILEPNSEGANVPLRCLWIRLDRLLGNGLDYKVTATSSAVVGDTAAPLESDPLRPERRSDLSKGSSANSRTRVASKCEPASLNNRWMASQ